jgi:peroxiredoxin
MKHLMLISLISVLCLFACNESNQYFIRVNVENPPDSVIVFNNWYISSDTTIIANGQAFFEGELDSFPRLVSIGFPFPSQERTQLVLEPGNILVQYSKQDGFVIGGTKNNIILQNLLDELKPFDEDVRVNWRNWSTAYNKEDRSKMECELHFDLAEAARDRKAEKVQKMIQANRNFAGFVIALPTARDADAATLSFYLEHFRDFADDRRYKDMKTLYEKIRTTTAGHPVADFALPDKDGNTISLSDFRGKWVLIDFWYTGCSWCIRMTPHLINIYNDWKDEKDFEILGISVDRPRDYQKWLEMVSDGHAPWIQVLDSTKTLPPEQFGVTGYPTLFLIDKEGNGTIKILGYQEEGALRRKLGEYVK